MSIKTIIMWLVLSATCSIVTAATEDKSAKPKPKPEPEPISVAVLDYQIAIPGNKNLGFQVARSKTHWVYNCWHQARNKFQYGYR